jgi:outer membrane protein assembly factor BamB
MVEYNGDLIVTEPDTPTSAGSTVGWFYGFNVTSGQMVWIGYTAQTMVGDHISIGTFYPPVGDGQIMHEDHCMVCWESEGPWLVMDNASNGDYIWTSGISSAPAESPYYGYGLAAYYNGLFYFSLAGTPTINALSPSGASAWTNGSLPGSQATLPTFGNGVMVEGFSDTQELSAMNASDGVPLWNFPTNGTVVASPSFYNGTFFFGTSKGTAYAVSEDGAMLWQRQLGNLTIAATPTAASSLVYFGTQSGTVYALNIATGTTQWTFNGGPFISSPVVSSNCILYEGSENGYLYAVNATGGRLLWKSFVNAIITSSPVLYDGFLFITDNAGEIHAFGVVNHSLEVQVVDAYNDNPIAGVNVSAVGPENRSGLTNVDGTVLFNESQAGSYSISASKAGYITAEQKVNLNQTVCMTIELTQKGPFKLNVKVVNSANQPISNASVVAASSTAFSNASGVASFVLPRGSYNVSGSRSNYQTSSTVVNLISDENVTLTLGFPYIFVGEIPNSNIILTPVETGYNITLLNNLVSSSMDVFIEWNYMGTIPAGTWQSFSFNHLPDLIVEAASEGTPDYPDAWYANPLPIQLPPTTGQEGAFLAEPVPYAAGSIFVTPYPPVLGQNTTIGVTLHDPFNYALNISRIDFQISSLNIGGDTWTSVGFLSNVTLQANETSIFSVIWLATVGGHHCVRVVLTYSSDPQTLQRNMDIEDDVLQGNIGTASFTLTNPYQTSETITLQVNQQLPTGWQTQLEVDGVEYSTLSNIILSLAAGQQLPVTLKIESSSTTPGQAVVDVQGYINGQLIGGVRKTMQTVPLSYPQFVGCYVASYPDGKQTATANITEPYEIVVEIKNLDSVSHQWTIGLNETGVSQQYGAPNWNWPSYLSGIMGVLGVPAEWPVQPQSQIMSSGQWQSWQGLPTIEYATENVPANQTVNFVFNFTSKWDWIPPWDAKYLLSSAIWAVVAGLPFPTDALAIGASVTLLNDIEALANVGIIVLSEQFDFQVSYGSTILSTNSADVLVPPDSPKISEYLGSVRASMVAGFSTTLAVPAILFPPLFISLIVLQVFLITAQNYIYMAATDPSSNYTQVVQPMPITLLNGTEFVNLPAISSLTCPCARNMTQTLASFLEYQNATTISVERYAGAKAAGDEHFEDLQLQAVTLYASQRDQFLAELDNQLSNSSSMLPLLNSTTIRSAEAYLLQNGLPPLEQQLLTGLGMSSSIPGITTGLETLLNATLLNDTILSQFSLVNGTQALQSLLTMETNSWAAHVLWPTGGVVGLTGYKLVFTETMDNYLNSQATINYTWSFSIDKWNGTQWVATAISGSSAPVTGYVIPSLTTMDLPYYVYLLPTSGSNAVKWGDWLKINCTFHWVYDGTDYSIDYSAELSVHPADIGQSSPIAFPYLGSDGTVNLKDLGLITGNWQAHVPSGTDPTSSLARADINGDGVVNLKDLGLITGNWQAKWTNTPPAG